MQLRALLEARGIVVSVLLGKRSTSPSGPQPTQEFTQLHKLQYGASTIQAGGCRGLSRRDRPRELLSSTR